MANSGLGKPDGSYSVNSVALLLLAALEAAAEVGDSNFGLKLDNTFRKVNETRVGTEKM